MFGLLLFFAIKQHMEDFILHYYDFFFLFILDIKNMEQSTSRYQTSMSTQCFKSNLCFIDLFVFLGFIFNLNVLDS